MVNPFSWEPLEIDSKLFGFSAAKITHVDAPSLPFLMEDLMKNNIRYATYRVASSDIQTIHELEKNGFQLVDILLALKADITGQTYITDSHIAPAVRNDIPALRAIAGSIFRYNRFYNDPLIPPGKANELFELWIENSVLGKAADQTLVYREGETILGFATLQKKGHIPLVGVAKEAQGKGIAKKLIVACLHSFQKHTVKMVEIETQLQNVPAARSYMAGGFKLSHSFVTFRWSNMYNEIT